MALYRTIGRPVSHGRNKGTDDLGVKIPPPIFLIGPITFASVFFVFCSTETGSTTRRISRASSIHTNFFRPGLRHGPCQRSLQRFPDPLAGIQGCFTATEKRRKKKEGKEKAKEGADGGRKHPEIYFWLRPCKQNRERNIQKRIYLLISNPRHD